MALKVVMEENYIIAMNYQFVVEPVYNLNILSKESMQNVNKKIVALYIKPMHIRMSNQKTAKLLILN